MKEQSNNKLNCNVDIVRRTLIHYRSIVLIELTAMLYYYFDTSRLTIYSNKQCFYQTYGVSRLSDTTPHRAKMK